MNIIGLLSSLKIMYRLKCKPFVTNYLQLAKTVVQQFINLHGFLDIILRIILDKNPKANGYTSTTSNFNASNSRYT